MKCKKCERRMQEHEYYNDEYGFIGFCHVCLNRILKMPEDGRKSYLKTFEEGII